MSRITFEQRRAKTEAARAKLLETIPFPGADNGLLPGRVNAFIRSHDYKQLALESKKLYRRALMTLANAHPTLEPYEVDTADIHRILCGMKPGMAAQFISVGSVFYQWIGIANPFAKLKKPKTGEWAAWTMEDVVLASRDFSSPTTLRLLFLAAFTGQRLGDIQDMSWPGIGAMTNAEAVEQALSRGVMLTLKQKKTGQEVFIPLPAPLFLYFEKMARPKSERGWLTGYMLSQHDSSDRMFNVNVRNHATELAQTVGKPFHGLRKTCSLLLAESECSVHEIAAVTGHRTLTMLARYTKMAEKRKLAQSALAKMTRRLEDGRQGDGIGFGSDPRGEVRSGYLRSVGHGGSSPDVRDAEP